MREGCKITEIGEILEEQEVTELMVSQYVNKTFINCERYIYNI
jgi:hypothetical protein